MFKKSLLLMLLMALMAPWAANGQQTRTVYDNENTSTYVPTYGNWADAYTKCEFVMPAEDATNGLTMMTGGTITKMKFYIKQVNSSGNGWSSNTFQVFLKEIEGTTISAWQGTEGATIVYEGSLPNPTAGEYEITFTNGYEYNGGNLLVGIYNTTSVTNGYRDATFLGKTVSGASGSYYNSSSLSGVNFSQRNFIPKTTFTYLKTDPYVQLNTSSATIMIGNTEELTTTYGNVTGTPTITYTSDDESVATVSGSGTSATVTAVGEGTATITATMTYNEVDYTSTCQITVLDACQPSWSSSGRYISNFTVSISGETVLNNSSSGTTATTTNYFASQSITAQPGDVLSCQITTSSGTTGSYGFALWVDLDQNGLDANDKKFGTSTWASTPYSNTFTIPANTPAGEYRLRILCDYNTSSPSDPCGSYSNGEAEDYKLIVVVPSCPKPAGFVCSTYTSTKATLTWTETGSATNWELQYGTDPTFADYTTYTGAYTVDGTTITANLTGLTAETPHYARVKAICSAGTDESDWTSCEFTPSEIMIVPIGLNGTTNTSYIFPTNTNYKYSYTQQIYTAAEIGNPGEIRNISFKGNKSTTRSLDIYMVNTDKASFSSTSDYIAISEATLVYSNSFTFTANDWSTITLDTPFDYTGSNLAIIVDDNSNADPGTTTWQSFSKTNNEALYFYQDGSNIPTTPNGSYSYSGVSTTKDQIKIGIARTTTPKPKNLTITGITNNTATASWTSPSENVTGYQYQYQPDGGEWTDLASTNATNAPLSGLTGHTEYTFRVKAIYGSEESEFVSETFTTDYDPIPIPYSYGFETADDMDHWKILNSYTTSGNQTTGRLEITEYAHIGDWFFWFVYEDYPDTDPDYQTLISPELSGITNGLHVEFYYRKHENGLESFKVGYSTTDKELASFTWGNEITNATTEYRRFSANYPANTKYVAIQHLSDDQYFIYLDDFTFEESADCLEPTNVIVSDISTTEATISWTNGGEETAWDIFVTTDSSIVPDENTVPTVANTTTKPYPLTELTHATTYYVYVRAICSESSEWSSPVIFDTDCEDISLPHEYNFEDTHEFDVCWNIINTNTSWNSISIYNGVHAYSGTGKCLLINREYNAEGTLIAVLPEVSDSYPLNEYELTFWAKTSDVSQYYGRIAIGIMTDPDDAETFVQQKEIIELTDTYTKYTVKFNEYTGSGHYIAIMDVMNGTTNISNYDYIDNIEVNPLPSCFEPTNLVVSDETSHGATFSWTAGNEETAWQLYISTSNVAPADDIALTEVIDVDENPFTLASGLTPEVKHYVWVRANCGGGDGTSIWVGGVSFTPTYAKDYTFNNDAASSSQYDGIPIYGTYVQYATHSQFIIPATSLGDLVDGTIKRLTFYSTNANVDWEDAEFNVYLKEVDYTTFTSTPSSFDWSEMTLVYSGNLSIVNNKMLVEFDNDFQYTGGNLMIGFEETYTGTSASVSWIYKSASNTCAYAYKSSGSGTLNYNRASYQPKVTFNYMPGPYPRIDKINEGTITTTTAQLTWKTPDTPTTILGYMYQYKLASEEWPETWENLAASATSVTLDESMTPGTNYDFRIKVIYEGGNESATTEKNFWTDCAVVTVDLTHSFTESFDASDLPHCWEHPIVYISNNNRQWTRSSALNHTSTSGSGSAFSGYYGPIYLIMPDITISNDITDVNLNFWARLDYTGDYDGITAKSSVVLINGNNETELWTYDDIENIGELEDIWETYSINLSTYKGQTISLAFKYEGDNDHGWYIDDVEVVFDPTCYPVSNLSYSNVTNHSATIKWTKGTADQDAWQLKYNKGADFNPDEAGILVDNISDTTYTFVKTLDAESTYYIYVRANCGGTDGNSAWKKTDFTTSEATPAPSNFVASNFASRQVDLTWDAAGGDYEESWELYYVKSDDAPEAPTAETPATKTVTTLPTAQAPYELDGLDPVSRYYIWVRADHGTDGKSAWVALTGDYFETLDSCPTPYDLVIANITSVSADLSWTGSVDVEDYVVEYSVEGTYSVNDTVDFSGVEAASYNAATYYLPDGWESYNTGTGDPDSPAPRVSNKSKCSDINEFGDGNNYLLMTGNNCSSDSTYAYAIMPFVSDLVKLEFKYVYESTSSGCKLTVGYVTDNTDYSTYQALKTATPSDVIATCALTPALLTEINDNGGYVTFRLARKGSSYYSVGIDDIRIKGGTYTPSATPAQQIDVYDAEQTPIEGLTPNTNYVARVKSVCSNAEWSNYIEFTTLPEHNIVFPSDGTWTAGDFVPSGAPTTEDDVIIRGDVTVTSGTNAYANDINIENGAVIIVENGATLTIAGDFDGDAENLFIEEGGQVIHTNAIEATAQKNITAYTSKDGDGWYMIASPVNGLSTTAVATGTYDLFAYDEATAYWWVDHAIPGQPANHTFTTLERGKGYLYANDTDVTLNFSGEMIGTATEISKTLSYACSYDDVKGYNLMGNPFTRNLSYGDLTLGGEPATAFMLLNNDADYEECNLFDGDEIKPGQGFFIQATAENQQLVFNPSSKDESEIGLISIEAGNESYIDKAYIQFGGGNTLRKMTFSGDKSQVYVMHHYEDYAAARLYTTAGSVPVHFEAAGEGMFTITIEAKNLDLETLRLIDNFTGEEIDLLVEPTYTFKANSDEPANRFTLLFEKSTLGIDENDAENEVFAYQSGDEIYFNGEGTLQVFDVMGRFVMSREINGNDHISTSMFNTGVYVFRLVGETVMTQKIVIR